MYKEKSEEKVKRKKRRKFRENKKKLEVRPIRRKVKGK